MINNEFFNTLRFSRRLKKLGIDHKHDKLMRDIAFIGYWSGRKDLADEKAQEHYDKIEEMRKCSASGAESSWLC